MKTKIPQRLAIWDPTALGDPQGKLALQKLDDPEFAWDGIQIRDRQRGATAQVYARIARQAARRGIALWVNRDVLLAERLGATGLVVGVDWPDETRPAFPLLVSIHSRQDLTQLPDGAAGCIYGHILPTASKPDTPAAGWPGLQQVADSTKLPVLAIGGLGLDDEEQARQAGAWGIAAIRHAFV